MALDLEIWAAGDIEHLAARIAHHSRLHPQQPVAFAGGPGTYPLTSRAAHLVGWSIVETTGAAVAVLTIINGTAAGAPALAPVNLAIGGMSALIVGRPGILATAGLAVVVSAGAVSGVLYFDSAD